MPLKHLGYLLHLSHYDPRWLANKAYEQRFDPGLAAEVVAAVADAGFDTLLVGVSDAVVYRGRPGWRRHYSQPMAVLKTLVKQARRAGLRVIPKLNFSRSEINAHNHWMRDPGQPWHADFDDATYWQKAFDAIDQVSDATKPDGYFHVGMDEDHDRSHGQYVAAIRRLHDGLKERKLRTIVWSDAAVDYASGAHHQEKSRVAEKAGPKDVVRLLWNYWSVPVQEMKRIRRQGHELWGAPGCRSADQVKGFRRALVSSGGTGMVMTRWIPCIEANRDELLKTIREFGPLYPRGG